MRDDRPGPGEKLNPGEPVVPRQSAAVILVRGGAETLEVLLVQRSPRARWMAGVWVFPGGAVAAGEAGGSGDRSTDDAAHRAAALRELAEEAGVHGIEAERLVTFSRWITPAQLATRFDTLFFLAAMPTGQEPRVDEEEIVDLEWFTPQDALEAGRAGRILLVFPTIKQLEQLARFASADELLAWSRGRAIVAVEPRVVGSGEQRRIALPGDPGYDA